jgi:DNA invertase Pin-like site-specific DNA recombinase
MTLRCGAYARYSSDRQSAASIPDQLRKCRELATSQGWILLDEHIYIDEALSGAGSDRPGFMSLLKVVACKPRPFDILLLDDTSRLTRNRAESAKAYERFQYFGIRVVAVSQGIDTQSDQAEVLVTVHELVDSLYIKELAKKTHRGLEGRALQGLHTGGRCFGYDNINDGTGVRQQINRKEAEIVRRIFEMAAEGCSLKTITKNLNRDRVAPARPRAGKRYATWCPTAIREMLRRELYIGRIVWNRSRFVKQPGTNKRVRRERPESEWRVIERSELRIVDQQLWDRVQARLAWVAKTFAKSKRPGLQERAMSSPHLLSGFLRCDSCGANLVIVTGRGKGGHHRYGCPQNFYRAACTNNLKERADWLERRLVSELQRAVLRPEVVDYAVGQFQRQLTTALADISGQLAHKRRRREDIQRELRNLVDTAARVGHSQTLVDAINDRERELAEITQKLFASERGSIRTEIARIRAFVSERLTNIRELLAADVERAKLELSKHVTEIRMIPQGQGREGYYIASGDWDLLGGYEEEVGVQAVAEKRVRMVAGGGFEPPTFGL